MSLSVVNTASKEVKPLGKRMSLAMRHWFRKEAPKAAGYGAVGGSGLYIGTGAVVSDLNFLLTKLTKEEAIVSDASFFAIFAGAGAAAATILSGSYRALRTLFRNPNSEKSIAQTVKWERDLSEPSWISKLFRRKSNKKQKPASLDTTA